MVGRPICFLYNNLTLLLSKPVISYWLLRVQRNILDDFFEKIRTLSGIFFGDILISASLSENFRAKSCFRKNWKFINSFQTLSESFFAGVLNFFTIKFRHFSNWRFQLVIINAANLDKNGRSFERELKQLMQPELANNRSKKSTYWIDSHKHQISWDLYERHHRNRWLRWWD